MMNKPKKYVPGSPGSCYGIPGKKKSLHGYLIKRVDWRNVLLPGLLFLEPLDGTCTGPHFLRRQSPWQ
jgi:hypothetical protein